MDAHDCNLPHEFLALLLEDGGRGGAMGAEVECHFLSLYLLLCPDTMQKKKKTRYNSEYPPYTVE